MKSEKIEVPTTAATDANLEAFHGDFREAPRFQEGGQHDMEDRGFGSGIGVAQRGENGPAVESQPDANLPAFKPNADFASNIQEANSTTTDWKAMYGNETNEKGQWRRTAEEAMTQLNQLKGELAGLRAASQPYNPAQPQYGASPAPQAQGQQAQLPETFFPDKGDEDLVEVKDVNNMVRSVIAPAVLQLHAQQQAMQAQTIAAQKLAAGLTPQIEQNVLQAAPWIGSIPEGPARIQAMQDYVKLRSQPAKEAPQPQTTTVSPEQAAARRVTYLESGQAARSSESEVPLQQRIAQEFAQARTAAEKKKVLIKYGMQQVNDWGSDVWGPAR